MGRYVNHDGIWAPDSHPQDAIPVSWPSDEATPVPFFFENNRVNPDMLRGAVSQAAPLTNLWDAVKFAGALWARIVHETPLPIAEWDWTGRGAEMAHMQAPSVVSGNVYNNARHDRYGPFRDPRQSQAAIDAYLASAMPREVVALENVNQVGQGNYARGFGAPGG